MTKPTFALIGEAGPELVIPVSNLQDLTSGGSGSAGTTVNLTIAPTIAVSEPLASPEDIERVITPIIVKSIRDDVESIVGEMERALEHS